MIRRTSPAVGRSARATRPSSRVAATKSTAALSVATPKHAAWPLVIVVAIIVAVLGYVTFLRSSRPIFDGPGVGANDEISALVEKVAKHVSIKAGERPTVATVEDANLLRQQRPAFYSEAENGDKLLVWSDKAVLYSPRRDVVLAVLPIAYATDGEPVSGNATSTTTPSDTTPTASEAQAPTIEVRNGTSRAGLARRATDLAKANGFTTVAPGDAKDRSYTNTVFLVKAGASFPVSEPKLAELLKAEKVETLPGEVASAADILVILGSDYQP